MWEKINQSPQKATKVQVLIPLVQSLLGPLRIYESLPKRKEVVL